MAMLMRPWAEWWVRAMLPFSPAGRILRISLDHQLAAAVLAVAVGVLCSLYPAYRASRVSPVTSLQYGE